MGEAAGDDAEDVRRSLEGDGEAYARIVRRHQGEVGRRMRRFGRDRRTVEELVHDVFVEAYFSLRSYRGDSPLAHWLAVIGTRVGYRHWKREAKGRRWRRAGTLTGEVVGEEREGDYDALESAMGKLSPRDRLVVTLLYLEGRSVEEAARMTGWGKAMVKVQAFRARGKLRRMMEEGTAEAQRARRGGEG